MTFFEMRRQWERETLREYLKKHDGNVAATARELGINRTNLFGKINDLGLREPPPRSARVSRRMIGTFRSPKYLPEQAR